MILFLDFDGVLHPFYRRSDLPDDENLPLAYLPRFESVLRDFPEVRVVVSSDWRHHHTLDELRLFFSPELRSQIIGVTPRLDKGAGDWTGYRQREALAYLNSIGEPSSPWIAIDDDALNWLPDARLVLCNDGFRELEEQALRALIEGAS